MPNCHVCFVNLGHALFPAYVIMLNKVINYPCKTIFLISKGPYRKLMKRVDINGQIWLRISKTCVILVKTSS